jgi:hypothetical protein
VIEIGGDPGQRGVTSVALGIRLDMSGILASSGRAVMTGTTTPRNSGMIEHHTGPIARHMAIVASIGCRYVCGRLALCRRTIVTTEASSDDRSMIDAYDRHPCRRTMTIITCVGCIDMDRILAGYRRAVVAT